jgi:recombinational DNA repair protein (RecF pathway)
MKCAHCHTQIHPGDEKPHNSSVLCEDCYVDAAMPNKPKSHYDNDAEFMQRLKDSNPVRHQQYH